MSDSAQTKHVMSIIGYLHNCSIQEGILEYCTKHSLVQMLHSTSQVGTVHTIQPYIVLLDIIPWAFSLLDGIGFVAN